MTDTAAPITRSERITNLDTVRGVATLGILVMNAVSFGLPQPAYFNLDYAGSDTALDWIVGVLGEVFVDQKTMAMFSMLFGAGIVVFADRAAAKGRRANGLSLWRNTLLLGIGLVHAAFWFGDVLMLYAVCSPVLLLLRTRSARTLFIVGGICIALSALTMAAIQGEIEAGDLGDYWTDENVAQSEDVQFAYIADFGMRAHRAMLIGVGNDWNPDVALVGAVPNILATVPMAIGYIALITLWNQRADTRLHERVRAVGRMALTNYLTQTIMGLTILGAVIGVGELGRAGIFVFILIVWAVQLAWSEPWLERFRFGPFEWLWRVATYRKLQPIRR